MSFLSPCECIWSEKEGGREGGREGGVFVSICDCR